MDVRGSHRLLVTGAGDEALRIGRSAEAAGYEVVGVGDGGAAPDLMALSAERLVALAMDAGVDVVHPGLGLRARDAGLAREVFAAGLRWAGGRIGELEDAA